MVSDLAPERKAATGGHRSSPRRGSIFVNTAVRTFLPHIRVSVPKGQSQQADFARELGASKRRGILLVLAGAGWHTVKELKVPEGIHSRIVRKLYTLLKTFLRFIPMPTA